ncbi:MAG TPA: hypothetical protein VGM87_04815 [Roseomonas sp.]|jgi:hypothetical protein
MVTWMELGIALAVTLAATLTVIGVIWRPLFGMLEVICQGGVAARFWTTFAAVMLVCGPLFLVCFAAGQARGLADFIRQAITLCSLGLIGGFCVMGWALLSGIRRDSRAVAPAIPAASAAPAE